MTATKDSFGIAIVGAGERGVYFIGSRIAEAAPDTGLRLWASLTGLRTGPKWPRHLDAVYGAGGLDHPVRVFATLEEASRTRRSIS
jgi:hypothetical protein